METTVLLTSVGVMVGPGQIGSLKNNDEGRKIKIIGTDMNDYAIGKYLTDKFYKVPAGLDPTYVDEILSICKKEGVSVIFPVSNEEALVLAKNRKLFENIGTVIATSSYEVLELAFNKAKAYSFLKNNKLPCPEFYIVRSIDEFVKCAEKLGFPEKNVVMKPPSARGGRGTRILTNKDLLTHLLHEKPGSLYASFHEIVKMFEKLDKQEFPELILMEYLPGTFYSVDFLARNGEAIMLVPKIRIVGTPSQTFVGQVKRDKGIEDGIRKISKAFGFEYNINIELKCSDKGVVLPYDINPRVAASVAFCTAAGVNLLYSALKLALGEDVDENKNVKDGVLMIRYLKEFYKDM